VKKILKLPNKKEIWLEIATKKKYVVNQKIKIKDSYFLLLSFSKINKNKIVVNLKDFDTGQSFKNFLINDFIEKFIFFRYISGL
jgi:hypothetical protein